MYRKNLDINGKTLLHWNVFTRTNVYKTPCWFEIFTWIITAENLLHAWPWKQCSLCSHDIWCYMWPPRCDPLLLAPTPPTHGILGAHHGMWHLYCYGETKERWENGYVRWRSILACTVKHLLGGALVIQTWHPDCPINRIFHTCVTLCDVNLMVINFHSSERSSAVHV